MVSESRKFGDTGEKFAEVFLVEHSYRILDQNYRKKFGEIDIVSSKDGVVSFVEVKTSQYFGETSFSPEIRIDKRKVRALKRVCETYLFEKKFPDDQMWQIDVISVILNNDDSLNSINHIKNAVFEKY